MIEKENSFSAPFNQLVYRGCKACGREEMEKGCNGEGRIQGGIGTVPGFGWWPIKAYRPCPGFVASGGRYRRRGQSMDEVAFGRGGKGASMASDEDVQSRCLSDFRKANGICPGGTHKFLLRENGTRNQTQNRENSARDPQSADMDEMTEFKVRKLASDKLGINLSAPDYKRFVRQVVETFLQSTEEPGREPEPEPEPDRKKANTEAAEREPTEEEEEEEVEEDRGKSSGVKEYDDDGDLIICRVVELSRVELGWLRVVLHGYGLRIRLCLGLEKSLALGSDWLPGKLREMENEMRRVTIQDFRGKTLVSIREFYRKDGKELPSSKGLIFRWFNSARLEIQLVTNKLDSRTVVSLQEECTRNRGSHPKDGVKVDLVISSLDVSRFSCRSAAMFFGHCRRTHGSQCGLS
ncbi:RNA polymerase II transcriptional coactivator KELP [Vitis vinifera]|uniref:RNA polymerase II transcriptional coactivator KELP n=1 Tax=Vitis vinifera TaxID=29760 RepID=A0A438E6A1_VITVI|nr:RNA polymerase II transcriptional coactivator KELP [Vitis vinifera]